MGLPGFSSALPTLVEDLTLLPRNCRWNSDPNGLIAEIIRNVTTGGKRYDYLLHDRYLLEYIFRFPQAENDQFRALHLAGRTSDFYYVPDSDNMSIVLHVRCEEPNYLPRNIGEPGEFEGTMQFWFDWTLRISTEVEDQPLQD